MARRGGGAGRVRPFILQTLQHKNQIEIYNKSVPFVYVGIRVFAPHIPNWVSGCKEKQEFGVVVGWRGER